MEIRKAERKKAKIKMALQGTSGSGKSLSALLIAFGLCNDWKKIAVIDTENCSADLYSNHGDYNIISIDAPYSPEKYIEAIDMCINAEMEVVIIDSISHCWDYLIELHSNMTGNSFTNWGKITPMQNAFINKILQAKAHVISTMRVKQDYILNQQNGKYIPEKIGLKAVQRDGVDYEFTIVLDINSKHFAIASKDRTNIFIDNPEFKITTHTGRKILEWCNSASMNDIETVKKLIKNARNFEELREIFNQNSNHQQSLSEEFNLKKSTFQLTNRIITKFNSNGSFNVTNQ
ncbi:AAA family ATPase [Pedobacter lithocola]|uniref:AAA family ATPase n=1 Tax=Pedobacter lithocola TaxID=1908239 RepID=A0ABV8P2U0_9SPHI